MTIRSFQKEGLFRQENVSRVNGNLRMDFHNNGSNEWLGFRLELIGSLFLCVSAIFMILLPTNIIKPGMISHPFRSSALLAQQVMRIIVLSQWIGIRNQKLSDISYGMQRMLACLSRTGCH